MFGARKFALLLSEQSLVREVFAMSKEKAKKQPQKSLKEKRREKRDKRGIAPAKG